MYNHMTQWGRRVRFFSLALYLYLFIICFRSHHHLRLFHDANTVHGITLGSSLGYT